MIDTPRTDEEWYKYPMSADCDGENHNVVRLKYARQLERENADLLEALEQLLSQFDSEIHNEYDGTGMLNDRLSEANHARRIIAKAKGGNQ
jgi:hypothetical protein